MSPTVLTICFIAMAVFTATVLVVGTLLAADLLPRHRRPPTADSEPRVRPGRDVPVAPPEGTGEDVREAASEFLARIRHRLL